jgi:hypothetical protein
LHYEELHCLCPSSYVIRTVKSRRLRWANKVLVRKHEGMRPLGRPRHRWEANIKMDLE